MSSLMKKSFQLGKAVYATVNEVIAEQSQKPAQHPQGGYYPQGGHYQQAQIPGQYTSQGQNNPPPTLPLRPNTHAPNPQSYTPTHQQGSGPAQGYQPYPSPTAPSPTHNQAGYTPPVGPAYNQNGSTSPYGAQGPASPGPNQSPVQTGPQPSWATSTVPTAPPSAPPPNSWTPSSPPPSSVTPFNTHSPYTPPTPLNAPLQPFPSQYTPITPSSTGPPQQYLPPNPSAQLPTPPLSPPLPSPPIAQPFSQGQQYPPVSSAIPPAVPYNAHPYGNQGAASPSPPSGFPPYNVPHTSPPPAHVPSPVSPASAYSSQLPHPPAFVSELPAFDIPPPQHAPQQHAATPLPEGFAELPAELPAEHPAKPHASTNASPGSTPPTIPAAAVTPSTAVEQPKPVHPPPQQQPSPPPGAYAPQAYTLAQSTHTPPAANSYQPYHPPQPAGSPQHAPPQEHTPTPPHAQGQTDNGQAGYQSYTPSTQYPAQFPPQAAQVPPTQQAGDPQRMGSLASKFQHMGINNPPIQYASYPGPAPLDQKTPQGPGAAQNGTVNGYAPNAPPPLHH